MRQVDIGCCRVSGFFLILFGLASAHDKRMKSEGTYASSPYEFAVNISQEPPGNEGADWTPWTQETRLTIIYIGHNVASSLGPQNQKTVRNLLACLSFSTPSLEISGSSMNRWQHLKALSAPSKFGCMYVEAALIFAVLTSNCMVGGQLGAFWFNSWWPKGCSTDNVSVFRFIAML